MSGKNLNNGKRNYLLQWFELGDGKLKESKVEEEKTQALGS